MMRTNRFFFFLTLLTILLTACSTTKYLPEDEVLYTGIKDLEYNIQRQQPDTVGVIGSIASALTSIDGLMNGSIVLSDSINTQRKLTKEEEKELKRQRKRDADAYNLAQEEVKAVLAYKPNNALFGSSSYRSPFPFGLWIYNSSLQKSQKGLGRWFFKTFSGKPITISMVNPKVRSNVAENILHNYGYFNGKVDYEIIPHKKNAKKAKVNYFVHPNKVFKLGNIHYKGFPPEQDSLILATHEQSFLELNAPFSVLNLNNEQIRLQNLFREHGYYFYNANSATYFADTTKIRNRVQLLMRPIENLSSKANRTWEIGKINITVLRHENEKVNDSIFHARSNMSFRYGEHKIPLKYALWYRNILHRDSTLYHLSDAKNTLRKLNTLDVFSNIDISYIPRDESDSCRILDLYVRAICNKAFESRIEMNTTMKSNSQIGPGLSFELTRRNAFRGGERISFKINGSYEWQIKSGVGGNKSLLNSYEIGSSLSFHIPRLLLPFLPEKIRRYPSSSTYAINGNWINRAGFYRMVSLGAGVTYKWHKKETALHELVLFNLDYNQLLTTTGEFKTIMQNNPALYISMRDQFIPSMKYTYTGKSRSNARNPRWFQFSIKEAGNLTSAIYTLGGNQFNQKNKNLFGNPFAQFIKTTAEFHEHIKLSKNFTLATRLMGGFIYSYGNSNTAPYSEQFYVGGANSVRAFTIRTIGPGSFHSDESKYSYIDQTGDIKMEANAELRFPLFGDLNGALFLDAGNVWLLRKDANRDGGQINLTNLKKIAIGTGFGFRYDIDYLILRLDLGIGLHAPYDTGKKGFYNMTSFKESLGLHFAIGYPF